MNECNHELCSVSVLWSLETVKMLKKLSKKLMEQNGMAALFTAERYYSTYIDFFMLGKFISSDHRVQNSHRLLPIASNFRTLQVIFTSAIQFNW